MTAGPLTGRLVGARRTFGETVAVEHLDLELRPGTIYGLLGPNGAGKTTTLRLLLGLIEPDRGDVQLFGGPPDDRARARVGYAPEQRSLPETARAEAVLTLFARMRGASRSEGRSLATEWLGRLGLTEKAGHRIRTLSNGQQQRLQLAIALLGSPGLLLLDEPLAALDPEHQELVIRQVRRAASEGATVVMSTHRLREAEVLLDHVVMLHRGRKVLDAPLREAVEAAFSGQWRIRADGDTAWVHGPDVASVDAADGELRVRLRDGAPVSGLLARAAASGAPLRAIERVVPSLHDLYLLHARALDPTATLPDPGSPGA